MIHPQARLVRGARGLADTLGVEMAFAERLIRTGEVRTIRIGRCVMVHVDDINAYKGRASIGTPRAQSPEPAAAVAVTTQPGELRNKIGVELDSSWSFLYVIRSAAMPDVVKVGISRCPAQRLKGLMCGSPAPLELAARWHVSGAAAALEKEIHAWGPMVAGAGSEWRRCSDISIPMIDEAVATHNALQIAQHHINRDRRSAAEIREEDEWERQDAIDTERQETDPLGALESAHDLAIAARITRKIMRAVDARTIVRQIIEAATEPITTDDIRREAIAIVHGEILRRVGHIGHSGWNPVSSSEVWRACYDMDDVEVTRPRGSIVNYYSLRRTAHDS